MLHVRSKEASCGMCCSVFIALPTGKNLPAHCRICEMKELTTVMTLATLLCFPTNITCWPPPRWGHPRSMPSCSVKQGASFGLPLPRFGNTSVEPIHSRERKRAGFSSWGYHDSQQRRGKLAKLFIEAVFCPVQMSLVGMYEHQKTLKGAWNTWSLGTNWYSKHHTRLFCPCTYVTS